MALLRPFRALRPAPTAAADVAAVPYDVVTTDEARALGTGHPLSFLHVSRAEIDLPAGADPYGDEVYETAVRNFARLKSTAPLLREERPSLYFYRLRMDSQEQMGVAGCYSLDDYDRDVIKKHERTRRDKEDDRTRHMLALAAQTGPVFLTHRASAEIDALAGRASARAPLYDFVAADGVRHTVWRAEQDESADLVRQVGRLPTLYIADGHHRAASAARARDALRESRPGGQAANWFLAVAFPDSQVQILAYNRIVRDLAGQTAQQFLREVEARCTVAAGGPVPRAQGEVAMYIGGQWHRLSWRERSTDPIGSLDVSMLQDRIIGPVLKIADVRTDRRIDFVGGRRGTDALEQLVDSEQAAVAFSLYPVSVEELMRIADAGAIMPPKSTWFEPKLRDGLLIHELHDGT